MIESSLLQTLLAVSKTLSFSKAAEVLGVTQSAVSQNIKNLETKVGFNIISRNKKHLVLTEEGQKLTKVAAEYFSKFDRTIAEIHDEKEQMVGELHVGTFMGVGKSWLGPLVVEFAKLHPELRMRLSLDYLDNLLEGFQANTINCLILPEAVVPVHVDAKPLHDEQLTLAFPKDGPYHIHESVTLKEVINCPLIFFEHHDPLFYRWCKGKFGSVPRHVNSRLIINSFGQMLQAVNEGLGIAVVPTHVFRRSHFKHKVDTLGKQNDIFNSKLFFVQHLDSVDSLKYKTFYEFLNKASQEVNL